MPSQPPSGPHSATPGEPAASSDGAVSGTSVDAAPAQSAPTPARSANRSDKPAPAEAKHAEGRRAVGIGIGLVFLAGALLVGVPIIRKTLATTSTDDAYVNGHVTFVAARVAGQVTKVFVDDNNRVSKGALLVQLDKEPYQIQRGLKEAAVELAKSDLLATEDQVRSYVAQIRGARYKLQHAMELVDDQIAKLRAAVAALESQKATLELARADANRAERLLPTKAISQEDYDRRTQQYKVAQAQQRQALEQVHQIRVGLGLPEEPEKGDLSDVPDHLDQDFSTVRQALAELLQSAANLDIFPSSYNADPKKIIEEFYQRDPQGDLDRIYAKLMHDAPSVKQAHSKLLQAERDLDQAELNLRYCDVSAEIDGVVTRRNVNPGNNVQAGQALMAIRSLTEIWVDANFKETQLADLRIGQRAELEIDMYGRRRTFEGRITGFTMGTGSTLALLPAQNATGNFIKVVQRLPVRIDLTDYHPDEEPLFVGLSVVPYIYVKEPATGPHAGKVLQPNLVTAPPAAEPRLEKSATDRPPSEKAATDTPPPSGKAVP
jgi:membrane fusion protein, multidrug efflux system